MLTRARARRAQHWQMILSRHCPLVQRELSAFQRVLYCSGVWNYLVGGFTTPLFIILPIITIFGGIFPIVISWWAAGAPSNPTLTLAWAPCAARAATRAPRVAPCAGPGTWRAPAARPRLRWRGEAAVPACRGAGADAQECALLGRTFDAPAAACVQGRCRSRQARAPLDSGRGADGGRVWRAQWRSPSTRWRRRWC